MSTSGRRTKIVATIGPASDDVHVLVRLIEAGMDVPRLNFSHGTPEEKARTAQGCAPPPTGWSDRWRSSRISPARRSTWRCWEALATRCPVAANIARSTCS